jgi:uncharacterized glyoxalase superfamily protein PhnB
MYLEEFVEEIWSRLALFQSRDVLERRYKTHHGGELSAGKADEIIAHLQQARQYFQSAEAAGVLAGPLEQYYGVLAFSRAIVLYRQPRQREAALKRSHGLEATLRSGGGAEAIEITVTDGTFHELIAATMNSETIAIDQPSPRHETAVQRFVQNLPAPAIGARFSLIDLLSRISGVKEHFEQAFGTRAHCHFGRAHIFQASFSATVWRGDFALPTPEELRESLGISTAASGTVTPNDSIDFRVQLKPGDNLADHLPSVVELESGAHVFPERFPGGWSLSRLTSYVAASHAMSMLVRYHPTRWAKLVNHGPGDQLMPVLDRLRHLIQNDFVRLGLRELERREATPSTTAESKTKFKPDGWHTVTPRIIVREPQGLIHFLKIVFGARGEFQPGRPAEMRIGDSIVMVSDGYGLRELAPAFLYVYVENTDATYSSAIAQGAVSIEAPADMAYGDRRAMVKDRFGNTWQIATRQRDP